MIVEEALRLLPCPDTTVVTPTGNEYHGKQFDLEVSCDPTFVWVGILIDCLFSSSAESLFKDQDNVSKKVFDESYAMQYLELY